MKGNRRLAFIIVLAVVAVAVIAAVMTAGTYSWLTFSQTSASNVIKSGTIDFTVEVCECDDDGTCECGCDECDLSTGDCGCYEITNTGTMELAFTVVMECDPKTGATFTVCGKSDSITLGESTGYYRLGVGEKNCFCLAAGGGSYAVIAYNIIETEVDTYSSGGFKVEKSIDSEG